MSHFLVWYLAEACMFGNGDGDGFGYGFGSGYGDGYGDGYDDGFGYNEGDIPPHF